MNLASNKTMADNIQKPVIREDDLPKDSLKTPHTKFLLTLIPLSIITLLVVLKS